MHLDSGITNVAANSYHVMLANRRNGTAADLGRGMKTARARGAILVIIAALASAPITSTGASAVTAGQPCGGPMGLSCGSGLWCDWPAGKCDAADAQGKCVEIPAACPKNAKPVCGCDRRSYGSDCERVRAGVQRHHDGACK